MREYYRSIETQWYSIKLFAGAENHFAQIQEKRKTNTNLLDDSKVVAIFSGQMVRPF